MHDATYQYDLQPSRTAGEWDISLLSLLARLAGPRHPAEKRHVMNNDTYLRNTPSLRLGGVKVTRKLAADYRCSWGS